MESLIRHKAALQHCLLDEDFIKSLGEKDKKKKKDFEDVYTIVLTDEFWVKAKIVYRVMEPLVKVLKVVDQDNKLTMPIIFESMCKVKFSL